MVLKIPALQNDLPGQFKVLLFWGGLHEQKENKP